MNESTTLLLVGHGSRNKEGNKEIQHFAAEWRQRHPDWRIEVCFIEHADVLLSEGMDRAAKGAMRVLVLPFILNAAGFPCCLPWCARTGLAPCWRAARWPR